MEVKLLQLCKQKVGDLQLKKKGRLTLKFD